MKKRIGLIFLLAGIIFSLFIYLSSIQTSAAKNAETQGARVYATYCASCHGDQGKGDGKMAYLLYPKPRDFTKGMFKLRSTPSGQVPTEEDLIKTISTGMQGTAMPSFHYLAKDQIRNVVQYVKSLSQDCSKGSPCKNYFQDAKAEAVAVPKSIPFSNELVTKGQAVYKQLGCSQCHGDYGKGDGLAAAGLKDTWGYPIKVRDFTQGAYLGGGRSEDLYLRFMTGMDGTPMPSFGSTIEYLGKTDQERQEVIWGLIYYVKSLETPGAKSKVDAPKDGIIHAVRMEDSKRQADLMNLYDREWDRIQPASISMSRLWQKDSNNIEPVAVRARFNSELVAVLLEWSDASPEGVTYGVQDFQDAAAIQFSLTEKPEFHGMGSRTGPVDVWFWRAEWQRRADDGAVSDMERKYGNRASDADTEAYPVEIAETTRLSGRDAQNNVSIQKVTNTVEELNAMGPGTLTPQPPQEQNVFGKGQWDGKSWRALFIRRWKDSDRDDVKFSAGKTHPVAFAVWNGSQKDRNGQKLVSTWYSLAFQQ